MSEHDAPALPAPTSRRRFARTLAAAAGAPLLVRALPLAGQPAAAPSASPAPEPPPPAVEPLAELVRVRYGKHLRPGQLDAIRTSLERSVKGAEQMKQVKLTNADEPDIVFFAALPGGAGVR
ncbi:MAG TPA: hypothetical protein VLH41_02065 [Thermoanaerobaculia bacterium]|nr:hypothetical protein [Thermoanaerobaculia bacterium]